MTPATDVPGSDSSLTDQDVFEPAFPIMGVDAQKKAVAMCRTAFAIGTSMYLTAGHVWQNALTYPLRAIGIRREGNAPDLTPYNVSDAETIGAFDLAILVGITRHC